MSNTIPLPVFPLKGSLITLKEQSSHFPKVVSKSSFVCWAAFQDASVFSLRWKFCLRDTFHSTFNPENLIDSVDVTNTEGLPGLKLQGDSRGGKESVTKWKCGFIQTSSVCWNSEFFFYFLLLRETSPPNLASSVSPRELLQLAAYFCKCAQVDELGNIYTSEDRTFLAQNVWESDKHFLEFLQLESFWCTEWKSDNSNRDRKWTWILFLIKIDVDVRETL